MLRLYLGSQPKKLGNNSVSISPENDTVVYVKCPLLYDLQISVVATAVAALVQEVTPAKLATAV